jgi:hydroxymethylpyrimidine/phosphomethylpyrimidine kinase
MQLRFESLAPLGERNGRTCSGSAGMQADIKNAESGPRPGAGITGIDWQAKNKTLA